MHTIVAIVLAAAAVTLPTLAHAAPTAPTTFSGAGFDVNYCDLNGLWNERADVVAGAGLDWFSTPVSSPGDPWQQVSIDATSGTFARNGNECPRGFSAFPWDTLTLDTYGSITPITYSPFGGFIGTNGSTTTWRAGNLQIHKHEYWGAANEERYPEGIDLARESQALIIDITVTNLGCEDEEFILMHAVDPDQDVASFSDFTTCNDTVPSGNFAFSEGPNTGLVTGYGRCDDGLESVGHTVWDTSASATLLDENFTRNDYTQHINHKDFVAAQQSVTFKFIFVAAVSKDVALKRYYETRAEVCCSDAWASYDKDAEYVAGLPSCIDVGVGGVGAAVALEAEWISPNAKVEAAE